MPQQSLRRQRWQQIAKLALPVAAEQLLNMSMGLVNAVMASNIGKEAISGISLVDSLNNVFMAFFSAVALGGTVVVAHQIGRKNHQGANAAAAEALRSGTLIGLVVTVVVVALSLPLLQLLFFGADHQVLVYGRDYLLPTALSYPFLALTLIASGVLRGAGDGRTPMVINALMNLANVLLGFLFIYGLGWGVSGAGFANLLARILGAALMLLVLLSGKRVLSLSRRSLFTSNKSMRASIFRIGIPSGIDSLMFSGGKLITQAFIAALGTVALAANYVSNVGAAFLQLPAAALAIGCTTLVGQAMGRKDPTEARAYIRYSMLAASLSLAVVGAIAVPLAPAIARLFTSDPAVVQTSVLLLQISLVITPVLWVTSFLLPAGLRGAGDTRYPMVVTIVGMWLFRITLGWILAFPAGLGVLGVWLAMFVDWLVRSAFFLFRLAGHAWHRQRYPMEGTPPDIVDRE